VVGCLEREFDVESRLWTEFYIPGALSFNCRQSLILQARTIKNPAIYAGLVGAVGIEPATLDSSGSIRMKENSVQVISVQLTIELH
jgi:hypothetical protein